MYLFGREENLVGRSYALSFVILQRMGLHTKEGVLCLSGQEEEVTNGGARKEEKNMTIKKDDAFSLSRLLM